MRPPLPPETALWAFFEEHRRCGDLDAGVDDGHVWMACVCGARTAHPVTEAAKKRQPGHKRPTLHGRVQ